MTEEEKRLKDKDWKTWGPYVSHRQWGTVREDYSTNGDAWNYTNHDIAESYTFRWGEEGIGGICDDQQYINLAFGFWNGKDKIIKERFFGLSNHQGNHGEDVKELYYHLESSPTHSYMKMLYKYPQRPFPYEDLIETNKARGNHDPEYEIIDTGIFDDDAYFDIFIEYAKASQHDILVKITVVNKGKEVAPLMVLPTLWFRNTWLWGYDDYKPNLSKSKGCITIEHKSLKVQHWYADGEYEQMFTNNESNTELLYNWDDCQPYVKDGINRYVMSGNPATISPEKKGTKAALKIFDRFEPGVSRSFRFRICGKNEQPFSDFDDVFKQRIDENEAFYDTIQQDISDADERLIQRQAFAGLMWNKQFYYFDVSQWLEGDPGNVRPPESREHIRNTDWKTLNNRDIISMPDKWEYPWYATWDLAFHCVALALIDPDFAKSQLHLFTRVWYMHPNGQLPAYEWEFNEVNPPVHAWATFRVFKIDETLNGQPDLNFLEAVFQKLLLNFTWWVNQKDKGGNNIFGGGFLGLDNVGAFDRNTVLGEGESLEQADGTSWMAMYALNMMRIALELAKYNKVYEDMATKFFEHFLYIANAINNLGEEVNGLWNDEDGFFYDALKFEGNKSVSLKLRSIVGLIPLFAVEVFEHDFLEKLPDFQNRMSWMLKYKPKITALVSRFDEERNEGKHLLSILQKDKLERILTRMLDSNEFLSDYGIRALSKVYEDKPYHFKTPIHEYIVEYLPAESDSNMFGGNSNWRGPIWAPINFLIIESLERFHFYFGDDFKVEYPLGSGRQCTLDEIADDLKNRFCNIFKKDEQGRRPFNGSVEKFQTDPDFRDYILFYEYFHGDNGRGVGASHQTGWTALVAKLLHPRLSKL